MKLLSTSEILTREVSMPDQAHKGVTFSASRYQSSTVTIDFVKWVDMGYPNEIRVTIDIPGEQHAPATAQRAQSA